MFFRSCSTAPKLNAVSPAMHHELGAVWREIDNDPEVRAALVRGAGKAFSAGGSFELIEDCYTDFEVRNRVMRETRDIVYNMLDCSKPIVSAMHGPVVGAGLVVALLADVSIAAPNARLIDGHTRLGIAAGDHAVIVWPLLCGMAKAKYHLLTCEPISGAEAERMGLVSLCVEEEELFDRATQIASRLASGARSAISLTKMALNNWYKSNSALFDTSLMSEFYGLGGPDIVEGVASHREKRQPDFR